MEAVNAVANSLRRTFAAVGARKAAVRVGPIGVDIALQEMHMVQLERVDGGLPRVRTKVTVPCTMPRDQLLASPREFKALVKQALAAGNFLGRDTIFTVPSALVRTISINYRVSGGPEQEGAAVARVMADRLDGDLSNYIVDYMPVKNRSKSDDRLALVAVSERQPVLNFLEMIRKAGLKVNALEIGPVAITRLIRAMNSNNERQNILVVNSGQQASYLTLISGDDLLFDQEVQIGEERLVAQVAKSLEMDIATARDLVIRTGVQPEQVNGSVHDALDSGGAYHTLAQILKPEFLKLVEEIKRVLLYAASETRGGGVSKVYLLGSVARWPGSDLLLSKLAGVTVAKIPDALDLLPTNDVARRDTQISAAPDIAVATGLALRGMMDDA